MVKTMGSQNLIFQIHGKNTWWISSLTKYANEENYSMVKFLGSQNTISQIQNKKSEYCICNEIFALIKYDLSNSNDGASFQGPCSLLLRQVFRKMYIFQESI